MCIYYIKYKMNFNSQQKENEILKKNTTALKKTLDEMNVLQKNNETLMYYKETLEKNLMLRGFAGNAGNKIKQENEKLKKSTSALKKQLADMEALKKENERMAMLEISQKKKLHIKLTSKKVKRTHTNNTKKIKTLKKKKKT